MKSFRSIIKKQITESPVGYVGRTKDSEALEHIEKSDVVKRFRKIVKELGGKNVARQLLAGMNSVGTEVKISEAKTLKASIEVFLRDFGYKIKDEKAGIRKKEIIFFKDDDAQNAYDDLEEFLYTSKYDIELDGKIINYKI